MWWTGIMPTSYWLWRFPLEQNSLYVIKSKYDIQTINGILRWSFMDPTATPRSSSLWRILPLKCIQDFGWKIENRFSFAKMFGLVLFLFVSCFLDYIDWLMIIMSLSSLEWFLARPLHLGTGIFIWKANVPCKVQFFAWAPSHDWTKTAEIIQKRVANLALALPGMLCERKWRDSWSSLSTPQSSI